jgi:hypothetical protein
MPCHLRRPAATLGCPLLLVRLLLVRLPLVHCMV